MPFVASAQEQGGSSFEAASRSTDPAADWGLVMFLTVLFVLGLFLLSAIGYLYRRERGLTWRFQNPEPDHQTHD